MQVLSCCERGSSINIGKQMTTTIGILGAIFFAICALPQVIQVWKTQDTSSLSKLFLILWGLGEGLTWTYVILQNLALGIIQWPLHINYFFNGLMLLYLLYKKFTEKKKDIV